MKKTIKIKGKEYAIGGQLRAMMIWEAVFDKPFELRMSGDYLFYNYCLLVAGDADLSIGFDEFLAAMEADLSIVPQFTTALSVAEKTQEIFDKSEEPENSDGKKKD